jgi:hypothetical protein
MAKIPVNLITTPTPTLTMIMVMVIHNPMTSMINITTAKASIL